MATFTKNYKLEKPAQDDYYDVDVNNRNMEIIDQTLKQFNDNISALGLENFKYSSSKTYAVGDQAIIDDMVWECTEVASDGTYWKELGPIFVSDDYVPDGAYLFIKYPDPVVA